MDRPDSTRWTLIRGAIEGRRDDRDAFARRYEPVVRAYLAARWRSSPRLREIDDAVQDVFAECFRPGGALDRLEPGRPGGFRAFLFGVIRIVALRFEAGPARRKDQAPASDFHWDQVAADDTPASVAFDRAWARTLLRDAADRQTENARSAGEAAVRRVELLRLRFGDGLPIREIARRWGCDPDHVHREYARARREFHEALIDVVAAERPGTPAEVERACEELLGLLG